MSIDEKIRTKYPIPIAEAYQSAELENNPQIQVQRWIDLFEETIRYLSLIGLSLYRHHDLHDERVEEVQKGLNKPSLGHWLKLFKALVPVLQLVNISNLTPPLKQKHHNDPISEAVTGLKNILSSQIPNTIRTLHLLDTFVEFRNKKIGHGMMTQTQAELAIQVIRPGLLSWLDQIEILQKRYLLYINKVEWEDPHYVLTGTKNQGTSLYNAKIHREKKITSDRVYLARDQEDHAGELIELYPFISFDNNQKLFLIYTEQSSKGHPLLRCTYKASQAHKTVELDEDASLLMDKSHFKKADKPVIKEHQQKKPEVQGRRMDPLMKPWYELITPHRDIREGRLDEAVFHADLGDVANQTAPDDYNDAYLFFKKTYLTQGLENLLHRVHSTLTEGEGSSVVQIQTPFGGGKTHALVTILHYLRESEEIKELLPSGVPPLIAPVVAIAGNHWNPVEGMTSEGITRRTFWGELAFQLAGKEGYEVFQENDESRISPGKAKIRKFLEEQQPFVLLFDEILEYVNRALDDKKYQTREKTGVSLGTQTFSFFQELTEAVALIPRGMMIVTLPSSYLEDFSDETEESLARLGKIFGRLESIETPVQDEEVYEVVRRRLFEVETLQKGKMREVVHRYYQTYQNNHDELPPDLIDLDYRNKMELAYPFHPGVIDILYTKWSTFTTFQRTRGVLRLLANVVEELYQSETKIDLILPGDINLNKPSIRQEFLKHIGPEYEGVIGSDIAGHEAKAQSLDQSNRHWNHLAERISTAIFYHSFRGDDSEKGTGLSYIRLAVMRSDTMPALVTDVLQKLTQLLWYLNSSNGKYYFSNIPNLNRMIMDKKELFNESFWPEMKEIIKKEIGDRFRSYLWPENADGIPDNRDLKLIILSPEDSDDKIPAWIERKGETFREYKNTLFFALADTAAFASLREDIKKVMALEEIQSLIRSGESELPEDKQADVQRQKHAIERDYSYNVRRMYHNLHLGDREIDLGNPTTGAESLSNWYWRELTSDDVGAILTQLHYRFLVSKFLSDNERVDISVLLNQFYKEPQLPVPSDPGVVARAIQLGIKDGAFGLIEEIEGELTKETLKFKTDLPLDWITFDPGTYLLEKSRSQEIWEELQTEQAPPPPEFPDLDDSGEDQGTTDLELDDVDTAEENLYHRIHLVISRIPASRIADINRGVLLPISRSVGDFEFTIELDVQSDEGISESVLENQIKETIRQIGGYIEKKP